MESIAPSLKPVTPVSPIASYVGGKKLLSDQITKLISGIDHTTYAEPFIGMGGIFFRREYRPKCEVLNDVNSDVANLFRIIQRHYPQFIDILKYQLTSREVFNSWKATDLERLTDLERAARFLYLQRLAFRGNVASQHFGQSKHYPAKFDLVKLSPMIDALHERLSGIIIECLDYSDFLERYESPETLFYLDPPYFGCEDDYGKDVFSSDDFANIARHMTDGASKFILSINDTPEIRKIFSGLYIQRVETKYFVKKGQLKPVNELIISNVDLSDYQADDPQDLFREL